MTVDELIAKIIKMGNPCAVGLDVGFSDIPLRLIGKHTDKDDAVCEFNHAVIDAVSDIVPILGVNVHAFLSHDKLTAVAQTTEYAKKAGMFVIADAKCSGDPVTARAEAEFYFDELGADCVTISGYYGTLGAQAFIDRCSNDPEKSIFVLARSEAGSPAELQGLMAGTRTVYRAVCDRASLWGEKNAGKMGYSNVGVMLGGLENEQLREMRRVYKKMPFLVTGYDGKRVTARNLHGAFDMRGLGGIVYVTRAITLPEGVGESKSDGIGAAVRSAAERVRDDLKLCF